MTELKKYYEVNEYQINNQIERLNQECKKPAPIYRYSNKNVLKCFFREKMQECNCNIVCIHKVTVKADLSNLCNRWDIEYLYSDFRYLGCYVPVYKNSVSYSQNNNEYMQNDKISAIYNINQIKSKYFRTVEIFNLHSKNSEEIESRDAFDAMRCAVFNVIEFCEGKVECEKQFFDHSSFNDTFISPSYRPLITRNRVDNNSRFLVWKFTRYLDYLYPSRSQESILFDLTYPELKTVETKAYVYHISQTNNVIARNSTSGYINYTLKPTFRVENSTVNNYIKKHDVIPTTDINEATIVSYNETDSNNVYFDSSIVTLLIFGLILNVLFLNMSCKSKSSIFIIILTLTLWTVLTIIGFIKFL